MHVIVNIYLTSFPLCYNINANTYMYGCMCTEVALMYQCTLSPAGPTLPTYALLRAIALETGGKVMLYIANIFMTERCLYSAFNH